MSKTGDLSVVEYLAIAQVKPKNLYMDGILIKIVLMIGRMIERVCRFVNMELPIFKKVFIGKID
ncbi:MAG: hypothetical protein U9N82_08655 [Thermodesulfobacteriota bacterium]|nr:hypothetical protein [Thermodesulfobacteriota bacterium]